VPSLIKARSNVFLIIAP